MPGPRSLWAKLPCQPCYQSKAFLAEHTCVVVSQYAGEMKKGVLTVMMYHMPLKGILPLHSSANEGPDGGVTCAVAPPTARSDYSHCDQLLQLPHAFLNPGQSTRKLIVLACGSKSVLWSLWHGQDHALCRCSSVAHWG